MSDLKTPAHRTPHPGDVLACQDPECGAEYAYVPGITEPGLCYLCAQSRPPVPVEGHDG
jgi:hypothetical protein